MRRLLLLTAALALATALGLGVAGCGGDTASTTGAGAGPAVSGAPRHIIYFSELKVRTVLERLMPKGPGPLEAIDTYRQMPSPHTILPPDYRIARVDGAELAPMTAADMAARLRKAINHTCTRAMPCRSHLVAIDDIDVEFRGTAGTRLLNAMRLLDAPSPWGSTYAKRVMMYVPIQLVDATRSTAAAWRPWADAARAVSLGESYWIEMYISTGSGRVGDVEYDDWTAGVRRIVGIITANGGTVARTHFMIGPGIGPITGMPVAMCPDHIGCAWQAARATPLNRRINRNGSGTYRFGAPQITVLCIQTISGEDGQDRATEAAIKTLCEDWVSTTAKAALKP